MFATAARRLPRSILLMTAPAGVLLALTACSSTASTPPGPTALPATTSASPSAAATTESATPTSSPTPTATATAAPTEGAYTASQVKDLFVELVQKHCGPAYMKDTSKPAEPRGASVRRGPTRKEWLVTDKAGEKLVVNTSTKKVYSRQGPAGSLPGDYTFDCDSKVFLGTWD